MTLVKIDVLPGGPLAMIAGPSATVSIRRQSNVQALADAVNATLGALQIDRQTFLEALSASHVGEPGVFQAALRSALAEHRAAAGRSAPAGSPDASAEAGRQSTAGPALPPSSGPAPGKPVAEVHVTEIRGRDVD